MTGPEHFAAEDWADFARGVAECHDAMQAHLESGCRKCAELRTSFASVYEVADRDPQYEPPGWTLRVVKAAFDRATPMGAIARAAQAVKLLFDSQLAAAPAGVRNAVWGQPRRLVFAVGDVVLDLQVLPSPEPGAKVLIGQVTAPERSGLCPPGMDVRLCNGYQVVAKGATNRLGEFQLEFEDPSVDLTLAFGSDQPSTVIHLGMLAPRTHS